MHTLEMKAQYHKPHGDIDDPYLPVKTAAGVAKLDLGKIYAAIQDGRLAYVMIAPGTARIRLSDLNKFLAKRNGGTLH